MENPDRRSMMLTMAALGLTGCAQPFSSCRTQHFEGSSFTVCRYDPAHDRFNLILTDANGKALRTFDKLANALGPQASHVQFAMNAGMFDADGAPIGLYVENGAIRHGLNQQNGDGNFYMKPNGVFFVQADGSAVIETTDIFARRQNLPLWATQSGPMLLIDGAMHSAMAPDGASHYIRNAVGTNADSGAMFVISNDAVSFGKMARFMRDALGCRDALYLDGYVSSLWAPSLKRRDVHKPLGPMLVVSRRQ